jgi:undecaprenyl-diphosphatase
MNYLLAMILGIIQGLTEFLPISSSGHLIFLHDLFNLGNIDNLTFDVALHWGTLLALMAYFYKDIIRYLLAFLKSLTNWQVKQNLDQKIAWLILLSMFPAAAAGLFFEDVITEIFRSSLSVAVVLILVSFTFFVAEKYSSQLKDLASLNWEKALLIGCAQALALIPGVSRSGITIVAGLGLNLKREAAARISFLMSIPIVFAAGLKKIYDLSQQAVSSQDIILMVIGLFSAALVGYFCLKYFLRFVQKNSLNIFAVYRIILGIIVVVLILVAR